MAAAIDRELPPEPAAAVEVAPEAEGPVDRRSTTAACLAHAAAAMAAGDGQEALAGLKAALAFTELTRRLDEPGIRTRPSRAGNARCPSCGRRP